MMRTILALLAVLTPLLPATAKSRAFAAVEVRDMQVAADWYARTFDLIEASRAQREGVEQRMLVGRSIMVELIAHDPLPAPTPAARLGLLKAGFEIADFDRAVARWRAQGVKYPGRLETIYDAAIRRHSRLLVDPDGNLIQVFGKSRILPRALPNGTR